MLRPSESSTAEPIIYRDMRMGGHMILSSGRGNLWLKRNRHRDNADRLVNESLHLRIAGEINSPYAGTCYDQQCLDIGIRRRLKP